MKLTRIFAGMAATAVACAALAVGVSAGYTLTSDPANSKNGTWELASNANINPDKTGANGEQYSYTSKLVTSIFDLEESVWTQVTKAAVTITIVDENAGYGNGQLYFSSDGGWNASSVKVSDIGTTNVFEGALSIKDGCYAIGWEEYGGGSYSFDKVEFMDASGTVLATWTGEAAPAETTAAPAQTTAAPAATTAAPGGSNAGAGSANTGVEGVAAVAAILAIAGAAAVVTRKKN